MSIIYLEDFEAGQVRELGTTHFTESEIVEFARQFDPQPFHLDHEAAAKSMFGGLIASGWHITAKLMRLLVDELLLKSASMGSPGIDQIRWLKPVRPGDTLSVRMQVIEVVPSTSKPDRGHIRGQYQCRNQHGELVMTLDSRGIFGRRLRRADELAPAGKGAL